MPNELERRAVCLIKQLRPFVRLRVVKSLSRRREANTIETECSVVAGWKAAVDAPRWNGSRTLPVTPAHSFAPRTAKRPAQPIH